MQTNLTGVRKLHERKISEIKNKLQSCQVKIDKNKI